MYNFGIKSRFYDPSELAIFMLRVRPGDLIEIDRGLYKHWAVYIGNGNVIHLSNDGKALPNVSATFRSTNSSNARATKGLAIKESLREVLQGSKVRINNSLDHSSPPGRVDEILNRAELQMKFQDSYDLISNNCEHFAKKIRNSRNESPQVSSAISTGAATAVCIGIAGTLAFGLMRALNGNRKN